MSSITNPILFEERKFLEIFEVLKQKHEAQRSEQAELAQKSVAIKPKKTHRKVKIISRLIPFCSCSRSQQRDERMELASKSRTETIASTTYSSAESSKGLSVLRTLELRESLMNY